ncbi:MAG TPA: hypothetical protein VGH57_26990 [Amycolatopsis sp.]|jgi:hypothetical protein
MTTVPLPRASRENRAFVDGPRVAFLDRAAGAPGRVLVRIGVVVGEDVGGGRLPLAESDVPRLVGARLVSAADLIGRLPETGGNRHRGGRPWRSLLRGLGRAGRHRRWAAAGSPSGTDAPAQRALGFPAGWRGRVQTGSSAPARTEEPANLKVAAG